MTNRIFYIALYILLSALSTKAQEVQKIRIDPSKTYGGNVSEYFKNVEYIPLETTKQSLFGNIDNVFITDSSYVIYDNDTKSVLFFKLDGRFLKKVNRGNSKREIMSVYQDSFGFIVIVFYNNATGDFENLKYSKTGSFVNSITNFDKFENKFGFYKMRSNKYIEYVDCSIFKFIKIKDSAIYLINLYEEDSLIKSYFPVSYKNDKCFCSLAGRIPIAMKHDTDFVFVSKPLKNILYKLTKDSLQEIANFVFPSDRLIPQDVIKNNNEKSLDSLLQFYTSVGNKIIGVENIYFHNKLLFFKIKILSRLKYFPAGDAKFNTNFFLDTSKKKSISLDHINGDSLSYFLPTNDLYSQAVGVRFSSDFVFSFVSSINMFTAHEATKNKNPQYPPVLQEYFKTQSRKSNPVIVKMKLKDF